VLPGLLTRSIGPGGPPGWIGPFLAVEALPLAALMSVPIVGSRFYLSARFLARRRDGVPVTVGEVTEERMWNHRRARDNTFGASMTGPEHYVRAGELAAEAHRLLGSWPPPTLPLVRYSQSESTAS
jgi:hypothetical protein